MALTESKQFVDAISRSNDILITFRKDGDVDAIATSLALAQVLSNRGKNVDVISDGFSRPKSLEFLPLLNGISPELNKLQKFFVQLDTSKIAVDTLTYDKQDDHLNIVLTPKSGQFDAKDVTTFSSEYRHDLIVTVGTPDLDSLGTVFKKHADFFFHVPVINIDDEPSNEQYGNINAVDLSATSSAEVVYRLFTEVDEHFLDEDIATCLLTGIIAKTKSFKTSSVTPRTLEVASELMAAGAMRNEIVQNLYRTRHLTTLKLWGRALARLKYDPEIKMAWTLLVRQDFIHAGASEEYLPEVIEELISNSPDAEIISVIYEQDLHEEGALKTQVCGLVSSDRHADALGLVSSLKPEGSRKLARLCFPNTPINEAEDTVLRTIYASLGVNTTTNEPTSSTPKQKRGQLKIY